jgi:hypothetical protein
VGSGPVQVPPSPPQDHRYCCPPFFNFLLSLRVMITRWKFRDLTVIYTYTL